MTHGRDTRVEIRSLDEAHEVREFPLGRSDLARFDHGTVGRSRLQPGWVWSRDVGAAMGLDWCPVPHLGYVISGAMGGRQQDGATFSYGAGDAFALEPGHDVWVEGDEAYVSIDVARNRAAPRPEARTDRAPSRRAGGPSRRRAGNRRCCGCRCRRRRQPPGPSGRGAAGRRARSRLRRSVPRHPPGPRGTPCRRPAPPPRPFP